MAEGVPVQQLGLQELNTVKAAEKAEIRRVGHGDGWQSVNRDAQRGWDSQNSQRNQERNPDQGTQ